MYPIRLQSENSFGAIDKIVGGASVVRPLPSNYGHRGQVFEWPVCMRVALLALTFVVHTCDTA